MTALRKKSWPFITRPVSAVSHLRVGAVGRERARQRRAHELGRLRCRAAASSRAARSPVGVVLEVGVGDRAQAIVRARRAPRHDVARRADR